MPLASLLYAIRAALLPIAGTVSRVPVYRVGAAAGFWAAALYIAARMLTLDGSASDDVGRVFAKDTVTAALAALIVLGVAAVPLVRSLQPAADLDGWLRRAAQLGCFLALIASGGAAAMVIELLVGHNVGAADVLLAPGSDHPPGVVLGFGIALLAGPIAAGFVPFARGAIDGLLVKPWAGWTAFAALMIVAGLVAAWSMSPVASALDDWFWRAIVAWLAFLLAPAAALLYAFVRNPVQRLRTTRPSAA